MKIWTSEHVFSHPWETVVQAAWRKYPNPMNPSVVGLDVVERNVSRDGVLRSHRLMSTKWGLPSWVARLIGVDETCYISEHSEVNSKQKTMDLRSRNLTLSNLVSIDEHLMYSQHPEDPTKTLLKQEAAISIQGVPMTDYLESIVKGTCASKAQSGRQAMEWVISKLKEDATDICRAAEEMQSKLKGEASDIRRAAEEFVTRTSTS